MKGVQGLTGCAIQVAREGTGDFRDVSVSGVAPAVAVALAMLQQLIQHAQNRGVGARSTEPRVEVCTESTRADETHFLTLPVR